MPKILHLAPDEKFINAANYIFEKAYPGSNTFLIIKGPANPPLKYVKQEENFEIIVPVKETLEWILKKAKGYELVVFHGLDTLKAELFLRDEEKQKYAVILWGAEVYNENMLQKNFLGNKTMELHKKLSSIPLSEKFKNIYRAVRYGKQTGGAAASFKKVIASMPNIGTLYQEEFNFYKNGKLIQPDANFIPFNYYPFEFVFKGPQQKVKGNNILLGNSASSTNNHLEAIDILSGISLGGRQVYIPLSYGDNRYAKAISGYAAQKLPQNNKPLKNFLQLHEYNELVSECGIVIMNHYRQQAVGNILASLYLGAKVFLNNTTVYEYLKRIGCLVFLVDEIEKNGAQALQLLSDAEMEYNRQIIKREISSDNVVRNLKNSLKECLQPC